MGLVVKRSVSFPAELFAAVEQEARAAGVAVSTVLTEAARQWLVVRAGLRAVSEWEAEHGALTDVELAEADALLDASALRRGATVVTSNRADIEVLADAVDRRIAVIDV